MNHRISQDSTKSIKKSILGWFAVYSLFILIYSEFSSEQHSVT